MFGGYEPADSPNFGLKVHYVGYMHDEVSMNLLYSAADVFVAPSLQENLPNTIMEAMAHGVPTVAFSVGGIPDIITHKQNGYLAQPYDTADLAHGILSVLKGISILEQLSFSARDTIKAKFDIVEVARKHYDIYREIVRDYRA